MAALTLAGLASNLFNVNSLHRQAFWMVNVQMDFVVLPVAADLHQIDNVRQIWFAETVHAHWIVTAYWIQVAASNYMADVPTDSVVYRNLQDLAIKAVANQMNDGKWTFYIKHKSVFRTGRQCSRSNPCQRNSYWVIASCRNNVCCERDTNQAPLGNGNQPQQQNPCSAYGRTWANQQCSWNGGGCYSGTCINGYCCL